MPKSYLAEVIEEHLVATEGLRTYKRVKFRKPVEEVTFGLPDLRAQKQRNREVAQEIAGHGRGQVYFLMYEKRLFGGVSQHELRRVPLELMSVYARAAEDSLRVVAGFLRSLDVCLNDALVVPVGSVAWGAVQDGSDLDILVRFRGKDRRQRLAKAEAALELVDLDVQDKVSDRLYHRHQLLAGNFSRPGFKAAELLLATSRADGTGLASMACFPIRTSWGYPANPGERVLQ